MSMAEFSFLFSHRKGKRNVVPVVLSRHPIKETIPEGNVVILPENRVITFMITATSADVPHYTQNLFMGHLTIAWLVYRMPVLFPKTQLVSLLFLRQLYVNESLNFICKPEQDPPVSKSQESLPLECNVKDFENLESLNRNRSSFAKELLHNYY